MQCDPAVEECVEDGPVEVEGLDARVLDKSFVSDTCTSKSKIKRGSTKLFDEDQVVSADLVTKLLQGLTDRTATLSDHEELLLA